MGKRETKETYKDSKEAAKNVTTAYEPVTASAGQRADTAGSQSGELRDAITGGYGGMASGPARQMNMPREIKVGELQAANTEYQKFRDTGGLSAENESRMRGGGGFDEFAKTGGYSDKNKADIKAQAISPIGSYATGTQDEISRRQALTGGYAPGMDAANRQLRRDTSRGIADTSLNANIAIQDKVNQGRQYGISGMANSEAGLAGLQTGNRLQALGGEYNTGNAISGYDAQNVGNTMNAEQFNINTANQQQAAGLSGLSGMYGSDVNREQAERDRQGGMMTDADRARLGYMGTQGQIAVQPGIGGNIMSGVGAAAGIAGGIMSGGATSMLGGMMPRGGTTSSGQFTGYA